MYGEGDTLEKHERSEVYMGGTVCLRTQLTARVTARSLWREITSLFFLQLSPQTILRRSLRSLAG